MEEYKRLTGADIRRIREDLGMSRRAFAQQLGISDSYVEKLEYGSRAVSDAVLAKIYHIFIDPQE
jgi:DNA-binding transcriptional regulator YiaG